MRKNPKSTANEIEEVTKDLILDPLINAEQKAEIFRLKATYHLERGNKEKGHQEIKAALEVIIFIFFLMFN